MRHLVANLFIRLTFLFLLPIATEDDDSFELCYNQACQLLSKEDWVNAEKVFRPHIYILRLKHTKRQIDMKVKIVISIGNL